MPKQFSVADEEDFVTMSDPITGDTVNVPSSLKGFISNLVRYNKKTASDKISEDMQALQTKYDTLNDEYETAKKTVGGSTKAVEDLKADHDKAMKKIAKQLEEAERRAAESDGKYFDSRMDSELFSRLPVSDFHNAADAKEKIKRQAHWVEKLNPSTNKKTGEKELVVTLPVKDQAGKIRMMDFAPEEGIKHFIRMEENSYLLKNKLAPGSGASEPGGGGSNITIDQGMTQLSRAEYNKLPALSQAKIMSEGKVQLTD